MTATTTLSFVTVVEGLRVFREQLADTPVPPGETPTALPLSDIIVCETVFQQRDTRAKSYESEGHVRVLAAALADGKAFDPVTVWWSGKGWALIDGHHRVQAYQRRAYIAPIPVEVFQGTPEDALQESARRNSRNKLPMTMEEKQATAIKLVLLTEASRAEIVSASGVSDGTVAAIRRTTKALQERGVPVTMMTSMSWKELREMANGQQEITVDFEALHQKKADEIKAALLPIVSKNVVHNGDALALALSQIPHELTRRAMQSIYWPVPWGEPRDDEEEPEANY